MCLLQIFHIFLHARKIDSRNIWNISVSWKLPNGTCLLGFHRNLRHLGNILRTSKRCVIFQRASFEIFRISFGLKSVKSFLVMKFTILELLEKLFKVLQEKTKSSKKSSLDQKLW